MKNLKTIITLLVLTMAMFSCQTNDELVEIEDSIERSTKMLSPTVEILIHYENVENPDRVRELFQNHLTFVSWETCLSNKELKEIWVIETISYKDFIEIVNDLTYTNGDGTKGLEEQSDDDPDDRDLFEIYYDANCSTILN